MFSLLKISTGHWALRLFYSAFDCHKNGSIPVMVQQCTCIDKIVRPLLKYKKRILYVYGLKYIVVEGHIRVVINFYVRKHLVKRLQSD